MLEQNSANILKALMDYFSQFTGQKMGIDRISGDIAEKYTLGVSPSEIWHKKYVDGGGIKKLQFSFTSLEFYDGNPATQIANMEFYLELERWIESNNKNGIYPNVKGAQGVKVLSSGYMLFADETSARYQIQLEFLYTVQ